LLSRADQQFIVMHEKLQVLHILAALHLYAAAPALEPLPAYLPRVLVKIIQGIRIEAPRYLEHILL
jgi:hypothetical protein